MKSDPTLVWVANWCNKATPEEAAWLPFFWRRISQRILDYLEYIECEEINLMYDLHTEEVLDVIAGEWPPLDYLPDVEEIEDSTRDVRKIQKKLGIVGPAMINGVPLDPPPLPAESRRRLCSVMTQIFVLWKENNKIVRKNLHSEDDRKLNEFICEADEIVDLLREEDLLDRYLSLPRLKRCPVCRKWFAASKTDQKYCTSDRYPPCREVAIRGKAGEDSPQRLQYREKQRVKMDERRKAAKRVKQLEADARDKALLHDVRARRNASKVG